VNSIIQVTVAEHELLMIEQIQEAMRLHHGIEVSMASIAAGAISIGLQRRQTLQTQFCNAHREWCGHGLDIMAAEMSKK